MYIKSINAAKRARAGSIIGDIRVHGLVFGTLKHRISASQLEHMRNILPRFKVTKGSLIRHIYKEYHGEDLPPQLRSKDCLYVYFIQDDCFAVKKSLADSREKLSPIMKELKVSHLIEDLYYFNSSSKGLGLNSVPYNSKGDAHNKLCATLQGVCAQLVRVLSANNKRLLLVLQQKTKN